MLKHSIDLLRGAWRYATGLRGFLRVDLTLEEATETLRRQLAEGQKSFLRVVELGIYANPRCPYRALLLHYGFEFEDVKALVMEHGIEGALARLYDAGVYVTLDEFKGRAPIVRPGLEIPVTAEDFDSPLLTPHFQGRTGASRGDGTRVHVDFDYIAGEGALTAASLVATGISKLPGVMYRADPPSPTGLRACLLQAASGHMPVRWFSPIHPRWNRQGLQGRALMLFTLIVSRLAGRPVPRPRHVKGADEIARYLADVVRQGRHVQMVCGQSEWVRICLAAEKAGLDISGTAFRGGGEPYTEGKAAVLERAGTVGYPSYAMHEVGTLAYPCGARIAPDDMHALTNRLAILQQTVRLKSGLEALALYHTTLLPTAPKLMLNVESGDYAVMEERDCGCLWQQLGFTTHIHHIRSYEKLTSEGVMFMGSMLHEVLEQRLPQRFGGGPLDYQLVEEEEGGLPKVGIVVSPRIGPIDDAEVMAAFVKAVGSTDWSRRMAETRQQAGTLRVIRREPYATSAGKILPLHVLGPVRVPEGPDAALATADSKQ
jgi:hypothetical protein